MNMFPMGVFSALNNYDGSDAFLFEHGSHVCKSDSSQISWGPAAAILVSQNYVL